jgi:hypothetical protein
MGCMSCALRGGGPSLVAKPQTTLTPSPPPIPYGPTTHAVLPARCYPEATKPVLTAIWCVCLSHAFVCHSSPSTRPMWGVGQSRPTGHLASSGPRLLPVCIHVSLCIHMSYHTDFGDSTILKGQNIWAVLRVEQDPAHRTLGQFVSQVSALCLCVIICLIVQIWEIVLCSARTAQLGRVAGGARPGP